MNHLNDLPKRHKNHRTQTAAETAFDTLLRKSDDLIPQGSDRNDYGTDVQVEVADGDKATNVRLHIQLKGTEAALNSDGSVSVSVRRATLNYLLTQPYSLFVCYHLPSESLRVCSAESVVRKYEHNGKTWTDQETLTVQFTDLLTLERLRTLADLARDGAASARNERFAQTAASPEGVAGVLRAGAPQIFVPDEPAAAAAVLQRLYQDGGADVSISAAFNRFLAVLGPNHDAMSFAYMSEINLGMAGLNEHPQRIIDAIAYLTAKADEKRMMPGGLFYCIGNAHSALSDEVSATKAFRYALARWTPREGDDLRAQICKNYGSSLEQLGNISQAIEQYRRALKLDPTLPEAHLALGIHAIRNGEYTEAITHLDQATFGANSTPAATVSGWRVNALFNLGEGRAAFREISNLLGNATPPPWVWPWCGKQVAAFGRATDENARLSLPFWERYLKVVPASPPVIREKLLNTLYLQQGDNYQGPDYPAFKRDFEAVVGVVDDEEAAYLWDRLGHWAQRDENWTEAEQCFKHAYELAGGLYGYCWGVALNQCGRPSEAAALLTDQAERVQPDDYSWSALASAYASMRRWTAAANAYRRAIALNSDNGEYWFNLGGQLWNAGAYDEAQEVWSKSLERFPDHKLADQVRRDFPEAIRHPRK